MFQFIESICIKESLVKNLTAHQTRINKAFATFSVIENSISLSTIVDALVIPANGVYKLRVSYDLDGNHHAAIIPYQLKRIKQFALVDIQGKNYEHKFINRDWINEALELSGKDEIIMHDAGVIKDCSYANLVFSDGVHWYTPACPLLEGTQRARLIMDGLILPKTILVEDLPHFTKFKCINAMMDWEEAIEYNTSIIE